MAPIMFSYNRTYITQEQKQQTEQGVCMKGNTNEIKQTAAMRYAMLAKQQARQTDGGSIVNSMRSVRDCTKVKNMYVNGKFLGRSYCVKKSSDTIL